MRVLTLFPVSPDLRIIGTIPLTIQDDYPGECYDDPRILVQDDRCYVSCSSYVYGSREYRIKVLVFDNRFRHLFTIKPAYGRNGTPDGGPEKNWTWFVRHGNLYSVYQMQPHTVVGFDWNGNPKAEFISPSNLAELWPYGECRMGTNPILIGDRYHCFFHSHLPYFHNGKTPFLRRQYFMGYYTFEAEPPFRILSVSTEPILAGNVVDERLLPYSPLVVFPCGAIFCDDEFVVSLGFNDERNLFLAVPRHGIPTRTVTGLVSDR